MADIKLKDRNDNETTYTGVPKLKIPAADGGEDVVFQLPPVMQEKTVTITANGTSSIVPDEGKDGLSKVDVTVDVAGGGTAKLQEKTETYYPNSNGSDTYYDIDPDLGYDGLSHVGVTVGGYVLPTIQPTRDFGTIAENGEYSVGPDEANAEAVGMVNFTVNVPGGTRVVTPLSETENVSVTSAVRYILMQNSSTAIRANAEKLTEYIVIQVTVDALNYVAPIVVYGDIGSTKFLSMHGIEGKVAYSFAGGIFQADTGDNITVVITPALLSDIEAKITAFFKQTTGFDTLEVVYSNPVHVLMSFL